MDDVAAGISHGRVAAQRHEVPPIEDVLLPEGLIEMELGLADGEDFRRQAFLVAERAAGGRVHQEERRRVDCQQRRDEVRQSPQDIRRHRAPRGGSPTCLLAGRPRPVSRREDSPFALDWQGHWAARWDA